MDKLRISAADVLGTGWHFPVRVNGRGGLALVRRENDIAESIATILRTSRGERRMRPAFGCRIHELIFSPNSASCRGLVKQYVKEALGWWEPRIEVAEVNVQSDGTDASLLLISIKYTVKATSDRRALVYPFYLSR